MSVMEIGMIVYLIVVSLIGIYVFTGEIIQNRDEWTHGAIALVMALGFGVIFLTSLFWPLVLALWLGVELIIFALKYRGEDIDFLIVKFWKEYK